jgi:serine/threonine-protein kinase
LEAGRVVAGRYKIDELIGMGGMAVVYRALDLRLDRYVTLKVLRDDYTADEEFIGRFDIEARAAASLQHSNIVSIYDSGQDGDIYYIVFEYVNGSTLKELITRKAPFDNKTTLGVAIQIASGLADAHQHNIIHRDIKPQNILVTTDHSVKITDFGIARAAKSATLDGSTDMMGSAHYFSPEQARGGYIDNKSDIYSLGIVMFEMATGQVPFEDDAVVAIALKHINEPLPDIISINPDVSESIIKIIQRATEKSASRRYPTVIEMADDLKRALTDASGAFVETVKDYKDSPTKSISIEDLTEIKRVKLEKQNGEHDQVETEEYEETADDGDYDGDEEYDDEEYDDEDEEYYEDDDEDGYYGHKRSKRKERLTVLAAIICALVFIGLISWGAWSFYQSNRPKLVMTPNLIGLSVEEATAKVKEVNLNIMVYEEGKNSDIAAGLIAEQDELNIQLTEDEPIHVYLSLGPEEAVPVEIVIPDVTQFEMDFEQAAALFEGLDVEVKEQLSENEDVPSGIVLYSDPEAGTVVEPGVTVYLYVSTGPNTSLTEVPLLLNLTEAEANAALEAADLTIGLASRRENSSYEEGRVCDQSVEPYEMVERHTIVSYVVSIGGPLPTAGPDPTRSPTPDPTETPVPTPEPTPTPSGPRQKTIYINLGDVPEGTLAVNLRIVANDGINPPHQLTSEMSVSVRDFPIPWIVTGEGIIEYIIYGNGQIIALETVNFDE